jgi:hypothetical protein
MKSLRLLVGITMLMLGNAAIAGPTWTSGHIIDVTFLGDTIWIKTDGPLPDNCVGTLYGWLAVPSTNKPMIALVTGIWLRGDASTVNVGVYTTGMVGSLCQINQIDPDG